jgi:hypothetical protein
MGLELLPEKYCIHQFQYYEFTNYFTHSGCHLLFLNFVNLLLFNGWILLSIHTLVHCMLACLLIAPTESASLGFPPAQMSNRYLGSVWVSLPTPHFLPSGVLWAHCNTRCRLWSGSHPGHFCPCERVPLAPTEQKAGWEKSHLDSLKEREVFWPHRELNHNSSFVQPVAWSWYRTLSGLHLQYKHTSSSKTLTSANVILLQKSIVWTLLAITVCCNADDRYLFKLLSFTEYVTLAYIRTHDSTPSQRAETPRHYNYIKDLLLDQTWWPAVNEQWMMSWQCSLRTQ